MRGFSWITACQDQNAALPQRKTSGSAGYDLEAAQTVTLRPGETALVATNLKAYMQANEVLLIMIRSSLALKQNLLLANGVGVIDADYYNNPDNEGHILLAVRNLGEQDALITKGQAIAQGIFTQYLVSEQEVNVSSPRQGGFGSTDPK
ncbi:MAG: dUTP diphosphatase [Negativicutes bacterium]|nr:dUTP diphosphatase [Negativicutes bacterium]